MQEKVKQFDGAAFKELLLGVPFPKLLTKPLFDKPTLVKALIPNISLATLDRWFAGTCFPQTSTIMRVRNAVLQSMDTSEVTGGIDFQF